MLVQRRVQTFLAGTPSHLIIAAPPQIVLATWNNGSPSAEFNNAAQTWNHTFYWESMGPNGGGEPCNPITNQLKLCSGHQWISLLQSGWEGYHNSL